MVNAAAGRREEIEDMQQELVDLTATAARQERDLTAARMQLEEKHLAYQAEVAKLRETIEMLESQAPEVSLRNANDLKMELRVREVKDRLEKLKFRNMSLQEENTNLRERLHQVETSVAEAATRGQHQQTTASSSAVPPDPFAFAIHQQDEREKNEEQERIAELEKRTNLQVAKIADLEKKLQAARSIVVTPAPPLPPMATTTTSDKKSRRSSASPLRIGFLRRKSSATAPTGGAGGTADEH
jgi:DNA repair exonuclease SbcCD ATPase subunit